jgi:hypothetical protein
MQRLFLFFLAVAPLLLRAQDLTGVWQGHFRSDNSAMRSSLFDDRYKFEVQIAQHTKIVDAVTYSYLSSIFYGKAAAAGTVNVHTGKVLLQEGKLLEVRNSGAGVCIMTCFLQYTKSGDEEFLEGTYVSMNIQDSSNCGRGTVFLRKVASSDFYEEPFLIQREKELKEEEAAKTAPAGKATPPKTGSVATTAPRKRPPAVKPAPPKVASASPAPKGASAALPAPVNKGSVAAAPPRKKPVTRRTDSAGIAPRNAPPLARAAMPERSAGEPARDSGADMSRKFPNITPTVLLNRENPLVRALTVNTNDVVLNIYDDGAIDHDTISVYLDNKCVLSHAMLTDRPLVLTVHLDESNDFHKLVLVAENEGEIPPNTSLMIVKAGGKEYEVRITTTEQKNAVITFKYVK